MTRTIIPFGPQHPVLPEPIHLNLELDGDMVVSAAPSLGYVHRGLEGLVATHDVRQMIRVVERVCGICSMMHGLAYCQAVEGMLGIEAPPRARFLRVAWSELHRMHSHLLWLGLLADAVGFENLFMQFWRVRERVMDINEATAGNRIIVSVNDIGGVRRDMDEAQQRWVLEVLAEVEQALAPLLDTVAQDATMNRRTQGLAVLTRDQALDAGTAGPVLRASGVARDMRLLGYAAYAELDFEPVTETAGDCRARAVVRAREVLQSIDLVRQALACLDSDGIKGGELAVAVKKPRPEGEALVRVEQPRGECLHYLKADGGKFLKRLRIRTPTFANVPGLLDMLPGLHLSDVPVAVLSIDPCISCTER